MFLESIQMAGGLVCQLFEQSWVRCALGGREISPASAPIAFTGNTSVDFYGGHYHALEERL